MAFRKRSITALAVAGLVATGIQLAAPATAATTPAWEPDANGNGGTISFYDAAGAKIAGGNDLSHLFDYAVASSAEDPAGFHKATVQFAFPNHAQPTDGWFVQNASASTTYPVTSGPASITSIGPSIPVSSPSPSDVNLTAALGAGVLDTAEGYANIMQIRLLQSGGTAYYTADISFDTSAGTWQQIYPTVAVATATQTALAAAPVAKQTPGGTVTLTASVTPSNAAGTVQFKDGGTNLGVPVAVSGGSAVSPAITSLTTGTHSLSASFVPTDANAFAASNSAAVAYLIGNAPGAPTGVSAIAGAASATVTWTAPASNGGLAITGYGVQYSSDGGTTWTSASATGNVLTKSVTGLTNGTAYVFRVAAINAAGTGAYSTPSASVTPNPAATKLTITASSTITYGSSKTLGGTLTVLANGAPIVGAPVQLLSRTSTTAAFAIAKTLSTGSTGKVSVTVKPTRTTYYALRYAGTTAYKTVTSPTSKVSVAYKVSRTPTKTTLRHGTTLKIYGTVGPTATNQYVYLQRYSGGVWKTSTVRAKIVKQKLPNGTTTVGYVLTFTTGSAGKYTYRAYKPSSTTNASGYSSSVAITVT